MTNMHAAIAHTSQIAAAFAARTVVRMDVADNCDQGFEVGIISFIGLRSKQAVRFDDVTDLFDSVSNMLMYIVVEELRPRQRWTGGCGRGTGGTSSIVFASLRDARATWSSLSAITPSSAELGKR